MRACVFRNYISGTDYFLRKAIREMRVIVSFINVSSGRRTSLRKIRYKKDVRYTCMCVYIVCALK